MRAPTTLKRLNAKRATVLNVGSATESLLKEVTHAPGENSARSYNAANPTEPLSPGDPRYVNCTDVRGDEDMVRKMFKVI